MPRYEYQVVPAPKKAGKIKGVKGTDNKFAHALAAVMNEHGANGWEYQRTETLPCEERRGFRSTTTTSQYMLVFRREIIEAADVQPQPLAMERAPVPMPAPIPVMAPVAAQPAPQPVAQQAPQQPAPTYEQAPLPTAEPAPQPALQPLPDLSPQPELTFENMPEPVSEPATEPVPEPAAVLEEIAAQETPNPAPMPSFRSTNPDPAPGPRLSASKDAPEGNAPTIRFRTDNNIAAQ